MKWMEHVAHMGEMETTWDIQTWMGEYHSGP